MRIEGWGLTRGAWGAIGFWCGLVVGRSLRVPLSALLRCGPGIRDRVGLVLRSPQFPTFAFNSSKKFSTTINSLASPKRLLTITNR